MSLFADSLVTTLRDTLRELFYAVEPFNSEIPEATLINVCKALEVADQQLRSTIEPESDAETIPTQPTSYRVEVDRRVGCQHCGHGNLHNVIGPDDTALSISFEDKEAAEDLAEELNGAVQLERALQAKQRKVWTEQEVRAIYEFAYKPETLEFHLQGKRGFEAIAAKLNEVANG